MDQEIQGAVEAVRVKYVRVTNLGDTLFTDRHDSVPLKIKPGESKNVPLDTAQHIFGWRPEADADQIFRHVQRRQGWNTPAFLAVDESGKTLAEREFAKLKIEAVMYKMVEVERDPTAPIAADPQVPQEDNPRPPRRVDVRA